MKLRFSSLIIGIIALILTACSGKETAKSAAQKWCDLNGKVFKATDDAEKNAAKAAIDQFEEKLEAKYKGDEAFMKEFETEVEKCEDASEGR